MEKVNEVKIQFGWYVRHWGLVVGSFKIRGRLHSSPPVSSIKLVWTELITVTTRMAKPIKDSQWQKCRCILVINMEAE